MTDVIYRNHYHSLVAYAAQIVGEPMVAEDIVQNIFANAYQKQIQYKNTKRQMAYLYHSVHNESISHIRHLNAKRKIIETYELEAGATYTEGEPYDDEQTYRESAYNQLHSAIKTLPPKLRTLFTLTIGGKSNQEIAKEMGISIHTARKQRQRGLVKLREILQPRRRFRISK